MKILMAVLLILCVVHLNAQDNNELKAADIIAMNAPDSSQVSISSLGRYFSSAFKNQKFRIRAIYTWTTMNITYDVVNMNRVNSTTPFSELVDQTMKTHKAVCQGFASVFKALCDACGITAYIVNGYTRQNGQVNKLSHAWIIATMDSSFYGFDPTWGAGYMNNGKYIRYLNDKFFMIKPEVLIRDHMPFDPLWECLNYPIDNLDFSSGKTIPATGTTYVSYADSIRVYQALLPKEQCAAALRRLESAGLVNNLLKDWSIYLHDCVTNEKLNAVAAEKNIYIKQFNDAVTNYNNCISAYNQYADYWNRMFTPLKSETEIIGMLDLCYTYLNSCKRSLQQVIEGDPEMKQSTDQLQLAVNIAQENMDKQKVFLKVYFNTDPPSRSMLFRNYSGAGLPAGK